MGPGLSLQELQALGVGFVSVTEAWISRRLRGRPCRYAGSLRRVRAGPRKRLKAGVARVRTQSGAHSRPWTAALKAEEVRPLDGAG